MFLRVRVCVRVCVYVCVRVRVRVHVRVHVRVRVYPRLQNMFLHGVHVPLWKKVLQRVLRCLPYNPSLHSGANRLRFAFLGTSFVCIDKNTLCVCEYDQSP